MAMTVSQMAHRAAKRGVKRAAFIERVRYWTREGFLETVGEHPGTGRHRRYDEFALEDALALNAFADFNIPDGCPAHGPPQPCAKPLRKWRSGEAPLFLAIGGSPNGKLLRHICHRSARSTPWQRSQTAPSFSI